MAISLELAGNFFLHEFLIFEAAAFEAFPRNEQAASCLVCSPLMSDCTAGCALTSRASSERLSMSSNTGESCNARVKSLMTSMSAVAVSSPSNCLVFEDEIAQAVRAFFVELVALHRGEHGAENFRAEDVHEILVAVAAEPEQQFAAGRVLVDEPRERLLEQIHFAVAG